MNDCCEIFPDLMERVWEVSCSCPQGQGGEFDPTKYYDKSQTDARIQQAKDEVEAEVQDLARDVEEIASGVADTYSKEETDTKLALKASLSDVYDKTAVDGLLSQKASTATTADLQAQINSKQDILVSGVNVKTLNGESLLGSGNISITGVTPEQVETMIDEAVSGKQDTSGMTAYTLTSTTAALQNQINGKQDTLVSGVNVKTLNGETLLGSGDIVITGGGGVTSGEVETMIDAAVSGKQDTSGMTAYTSTATTDSLSGTVTGHTSDQTIHVTAADKNTWNTVSTKADATALTAVNNALTAHTSDQAIHVTAADKANWDAKVDQSDLDDYATTATVATKADITALTQVNGVLTAHTSDSVIHVTQANKNTWNTVTGKADASAVTAVNNALTGHTADTTVHTTASEKATWNAKQDAISDIATIRSNASNAVAQLNGYTITSMTKTQFDALTVKDPNTIYFVKD